MKQNLDEYQFAPPVLGRKTHVGRPAECRWNASTRCLNVKEEYLRVLCDWRAAALHNLATGRIAEP